MRLPRPREIVEPVSPAGASLAWIAGIAVLFAPPAAIIAHAAYMASPGVGDEIVGAFGILLIATWVALGAFYLALLREAPRFGRAHGHRYRLIYANPKLLFGLWLLHAALGWIAIGLAHGSIGPGGTVDARHAERGAGIFLVAFAIAIALWGWGRYRGPR